jgi:hypothetical protein
LDAPTFVRPVVMSLRVWGNFSERVGSRRLRNRSQVFGLVVRDHVPPGTCATAGAAVSTRTLLTTTILRLVRIGRSS